MHSHQSPWRCGPATRKALGMPIFGALAATNDGASAVEPKPLGSVGSIGFRFV